MDRQTTLYGSGNGSGSRDPSAAALSRHVAGIAYDLFTIAELQLRLFARDLQSLRKGIVRGLAMWALAVGLLFAAMPTALIGAGLWLAETAQLSTAAGLLWVAAGTFLIMIGLLSFGWREFTRQRAALRNSTKEFHNNLRTMRQILSSYAGRGLDE